MVGYNLRAKRLASLGGQTRIRANITELSVLAKTQDNQDVHQDTTKVSILKILGF